MTTPNYQGKHRAGPKTRDLPAGHYRIPKTEYVFVREKGQTTAGNAAGTRKISVSDYQGKTSMPMFLRNREVIFAAWIAAMAVVCWDEWKNYGVLPRPGRLWSTSLLYGLLALLGGIDLLVPLVNVLAIAFVITLLYQYYNHQGQFANSGSGGFGSAANPPATTNVGSQIYNAVIGSLNNLLGGAPSVPSGPATTPNNTPGHPLQAP